MTEPRTPPDWELAESLYRAGHLSLAEIGSRVGVSKQAIDKRAKKLGWERDLTQQVRQAIKAKLTQQAVDDSVDGFHGKGRPSPVEIVEAAAEQGAQVVQHHRRDIKAGRELCALLMGQLYEATTEREAIELAIMEETAGDPFPHRRRQMLNAVNLASRAGVIRDLATAMKSLQALERTAFGLKEEAGDEIPDYEKRLEALANSAPG